MVPDPSLDDAVAARVAAAAARWRPGTTLAELRPLPGGQSSLTYRADLVVDGAPTALVVKVAPPGLAPVRNRDVLRQARLLALLHAEGGVPVPAVRFTDEGAPPEVPPLFAMDFVAGESVEPLFDRVGPVDAATAAALRARAGHAARLLAALHRVPTTAHPLLAAEPAWSGAEEVTRWSRALATVEPALVPGWEASAEALAGAAPAPGPAVVSHGDYRIGNMLAVGGQVTAVIDWEIWSVADPRLDLAWFRLNADPPVYDRAGTPGPAAMPDPDALRAVYEDAAGRVVADLGWFDALIRFKAAAIWALLVKHARRAGRADLDDVVDALPRLLDQARTGAGPST